MAAWLHSTPSAGSPNRPRQTSAVPYFICPNCQNRSFDEDGREGLSHQARGCHECGFGFVFQLLEDYFPRPGAGFAVCDSEARVIAAGKGLFEVTGRLEQTLVDAVAQAARPEMPHRRVHAPASQIDEAVRAVEGGVRRKRKAPVQPGLAGEPCSDERVMAVCRLGRQDIQPCGGHAPVAQRRGQRVEIDDRPARRVDQDQSGLGCGEGGRADQADRLEASTAA